MCYNLYMYKIITTLSLAALAVIAIDVAGEKSVTDVGEPYVYSFSVCTQWNSGAKGVSHCGKWKPAQETRMKTIREGGLFTRESYRIVK